MTMEFEDPGPRNLYQRSDNFRQTVAQMILLIVNPKNPDASSK